MEFPKQRTLTGPWRHFAVLAILAASSWARLPEDFLDNSSAGASGSSIQIPSSSQFPKAPSSRMEVPPMLPELSPMFEAIEDSTYILGPGDILYVSFGPKSAYVTVNPDGQVILEGAEPVRVYGETLARAKEIIAQQFANKFKKHKVLVSLAQAKKIVVSVTGKVAIPGLYAMESGKRLSDLVWTAGGFTNEASRRVRIQRKTGRQFEVDLHTFFAEGSLDQNPYLRQGDQIFFPSLSHHDKLVYIREDKFFRPIQLREGDNLEGLIFRYDNFRNSREWSYVQVYRREGKREMDVATVLRREAAEYLPDSGAILEIHTPKPYVFVSGDVARPGYFEYNPNMTALDYVYLAGVLPSTGKMESLTVLDKEGRKRTVGATSEPIHVGDHIQVPKSFKAMTMEYMSLMLAFASLGVAIATLASLR